MEKKLCWYHYAFIAIGAACGMFAWNVWRGNRAEYQRVGPDDAHTRAWQKLSVRLQQAEKGDAELSARHAGRIRAYFGEKRNNSRLFAEELVSWGGKWEWLKAKVANDNDRIYDGYLRETFERYFFSERDLKFQMERMIAGYVSELEGRENKLLVEIRADLNTDDLPDWRAIATGRSDDVFRKEYHQLITQVMPTINTDLTMTVGREVVSFVATDIATAATVRIGSSVAAELGVSGGILGTGVVSGTATLGIGLVVGFAVDAIVDRLMRNAGYDPVQEIASQASYSITRIEMSILDGNYEARLACKQLRRIEATDPFLFVREDAKKSADRIDAANRMGLEHELERVAYIRARLREAALKKMLLQGRQS